METGITDRYRVLIIEENDHFRQTLKEFLNPRYQTLMFEEAKFGEEGIRKFGFFKPDIVFVDVRLSDRAGLDLIEIMRGLDPKVNIIVLSNYDLPEYREAAFRKGSDFFISKGSSTIDMILNAMQLILPALQKKRLPCPPALVPRFRNPIEGFE